MIQIDVLEGHRTLAPHVVILGAGGNGSYFIQHLAQMMSIFEIPGSIVVSDPDILETKNLRNQLFVSPDVGQHKATVLSKRYSIAYGIPIASHVSGFVESVEELEEMFRSTRQDVLLKQTKDRVLYLPILIGAVDNHFTRKVMHDFFMKQDDLLYIDVGNTASTVPADWRERPKHRWSAEELQAFNDTGWNGQAVCGLRRNGETVLQPAAHYFPEILTSNDEIAPSQLSCSQLSASTPQKVLTNKYSALAAATYMNELFDTGTISHQLTLFHAKRGFMKAVPIQETE